MPIEFYLVLLTGIAFIYLGYLVYSGKAPTLVKFFNIIPEYDPRLLRFFGVVIITVGIILLFLPLILGVENINPL